MSLQYLLDGYNIVHQIPDLVKLDIQQQREALLRSIERHQPQGSRQNLLTVVFDGRRGNGPVEVSGTIKVIYSLDESADDKIIRLVSEARNKKNIIVVTDDRSIQSAVKALGARIVKVGEFLQKLAPRTAVKGSDASKGSKREPPKYIPQELEAKINSELADIWLKKKQGGSK